jgi:aminoglycoside phosphotransferase (APT) family kinase protein
MDVRPVTLPERGMDYYRRHASQARARLTAAAADPSVPDHELLFDHLRLLDRVERRWEVLTEHATRLPQTLAHGDFVRKNLRARAADGGTDVYVLDWETAGRGSPAADLASLSTMFGDAERAAALAVYAEITRRHWPEADVKAIERTRRAGVILRLLASVEWASHGLGYGYDERSLRHLRSYATALRAATVEMRRS